MDDLDRITAYRNSPSFWLHDLWEALQLGLAIALGGFILYLGATTALMRHAGMNVW
jgi:hypothetical protein